MRRALMIIAVLAVPAAAHAGDELEAPARASVSIGAGPLLGSSGGSAGIGAGYSLIPQLAVIAELHGAMDRDGDTGLMASAGLRFTPLPRQEVSPYLFATYGYGQAYQDSGKAFQVGAGLAFRVDRRFTAFAEIRGSLIDAGGYDIPYLDVPLRFGVRLDLR